MLRMFGYIALVLVPLIVLFAIVLAIGFAIFGLAVVRSDVFGLFVIASAAFALTTSVTVGIVLARAKSPPHQEPPSA